MQHLIASPCHFLWLLLLLLLLLRSHHCWHTGGDTLPLAPTTVDSAVPRVLLMEANAAARTLRKEAYVSVPRQCCVTAGRVRTWTCIQMTLQAHLNHAAPSIPWHHHRIQGI